MESSLELLGSGGGGGGGGMGLSCEQSTGKVEKDYMSGAQEEEEEEGGLELGLGLSLGNSGGGGGAAAKGKVSAWGEYGRILTAKDFPNGFLSAASGTKRERTSDSVHQGSASAAVSQVVGWPPIRSYRMNTLFTQSKTSNAEEANDKGVDGNEISNENSNKKFHHGNNDKKEASTKDRGHLGFVKVNVDGLAIGRKVDLNAHKSYESLENSLKDMFFNQSLVIRGGKEQSTQPPKLLDGSSEFVLTYEDKEGDWMLVGDVPWGMFINTVKRLRIMRTSEANGLAPKSQERNENRKAKPI